MVFKNIIQMSKIMMFLSIKVEHAEGLFITLSNIYDQNSYALNIFAKISI